MTKEKILAFSQAHAEPTWLQELRLKAFDVMPHLELPTIERLNFTVGTLVMVA